MTSADKDDDRLDTAGHDETKLDAGTSLASGEAVPKVGERFADGSVTSVQSHGGSSGCHAVTVEYAPDWSCSPAQIEAAKSGVTSGGRDAPAQDDSSLGLRVSTCAELAALRRPQIKSSQRLTLDGQRQQLLRKCLPRRETRYVSQSGDGSFCRGFSTVDAGSRASPSRPVAEGADSTEGAKEYSTTNTQVADVDEADFVKNDSGYVYVLSKAGLHVIDAWPAADTHQVALLSIAGAPTRLFLAGNKLVVYARTGDEGSIDPSGAQSCTYGYDCRSQAEPGSTSVQVFDVSEPALPRELGRYEFSGGYVASRRIGNAVYTVVSDQGLGRVPGVDLTLPVTEPGQLDAAYEDKLRQADAMIDGLANEYFLPWARTKSATSEQTTPLGCEGGLVAKSASGATFTSLISFDLAALGTPRRVLVATKPGFVYASSSALYIATDGTTGDDRYTARGGSDEQSTIHKFALDGVTTPYVGSSLIPGHVLNQFSMDERESVLRVATSSGWVGTPGVSSNIVTLGVQNGALTVVGQLNKLAPEEDIRSVRFDGERGFVVTFKKTDPLFVIDLLDPTKPRVLGELKIPGFSTYMHPMDKDHVLAIGLDADDKGSFAFFNGIQLQIFDVSELSNPKLQHKTVIGTRGSASEALTNHLAFNYFAPKGLLAMPMTVCDGGGDGTFGDKLSFSGLMVFDVSLATGITERGRMPFVNAAAESANIPSCSSWWTQATSSVKRSIIMDDFVVGLSDSLYQVSALGMLASPLKTLPLGR